MLTFLRNQHIIEPNSISSPHPRTYGAMALCHAIDAGDSH